MLRRLEAGLFAPVPVGGLVLFRVALGALLAWDAWRLWSKGWIRLNFVEPSFHFTFFGFDWVKPWPEPWMTAHVVVLGLLGLGLMTGTAYRVSAVLSFVGWAYVFLLDLSLYLNHLYLLLLLVLLMVFVPAHRAWSVDAWLRPALRGDWAPGWALWIVRLQLSVAYVFGGIAKINPDWLRGEPLRTWLAPHTQSEAVVMLMSLGGLAFDLLIVPALLWRRTRWVALIVAVGFHLTNAWLFQIGIFPWLMLAATLLFLPPELFARFSGRAAGVAQPSARSAPVLVLFALWMAGQVTVPLRHWLYPGDVAWTEEGHIFSWRMKLTQKDNDTEFIVTFKSEAKTWSVPLDQFLTSRQEDKMAGDPEMILQFAHHLKRTLGDVEVRVRTNTSLNRRPPRQLVDPTVDLAAQPRTLWAAPWIRGSAAF